MKNLIAADKELQLLKRVSEHKLQVFLTLKNHEITKGIYRFTWQQNQEILLSSYIKAGQKHLL